MTHAQKDGVVEFLLLPLISLVWLIAVFGCVLMALAKRIAHYGRDSDGAASPHRPVGNDHQTTIQTPLPNMAKIRRRRRRAHGGIAARRAY